MARPTRTRPAGGNRMSGDAYTDDPADWLDWDHWQGVEEYQDIVDGLGGALPDDATDGDAADDTATRRLRRGLIRRGIALED